MSTITDRHLLITDLLLGAVHADDRMKGEETAAVRRLMERVLDVDELPEEIDEHIDGFDPDAFDLDEAAADFASDPPIKKRRLLELVAAVFDADEEVDFEEDAYMRSLAEALGVPEDEYKDLALHYEVEDLPAVVREVVPPPVPRR